MRQIVWQWPDASEQWNEVRVGIGECVLDRLRWRRRLAAQECGIEGEQGGNDVVAAVQRRPLDEPDLEADAGFTPQPRLALQPASERGQIALLGRAPDLLHCKRSPQ